MTGFTALHVRRLLDAPVRLLLSLLSIAVSSALVVAMIALFGSLTGSVRNLSDAAPRADLEVAALTDAGFDAGVVNLVRSIEGVARATPLSRVAVSVGGRPAILIGIDPTTAGQAGDERLRDCVAPVGNPATAAADMVVGIGPGIAPSDGVLTVVEAGARHEAAVGAIIDCPAARTLNGGGFIVSDQATAEVLTGRPGRIDAVYVDVHRTVGLEEVRRRLEAAVGDRAVVSSPSERLELAEENLSPLRQGMLVAVSLAFVVAGFLVFNTMNMVAGQRRRELATLRALGARRRSLLIGFIGEAALVGFIGACAGAAVGAMAARGVLGFVPTIYVDFLGVTPTFTLPPSAIPAATVMGTFAAIVGAAVPAISATSVSPIDAMRPEGIDERGGRRARTRPLLVVGGAVALLIGVALAVVAQGNLVIVSFTAIMFGVIAITAGLMVPLADAVAAIAARAGRSGRLAAAGIERAPRRTWATVIAVVVAVGVVVAIGGIAENQRSTFAAAFAPMSETEIWVQTSPSDTNATAADLPFGLRDALLLVDGVADVVGNQAAYLNLNGEQVLLQGMGVGSNTPLFRAASDEAADVARVGGRGAIVTAAWARRHGLEVGDPISLPSPTGAHTERVAAIVDIPVIVQGQIGIGFDRFNAWYQRAAATAYEIGLLPGAQADEVRRRIETLLASQAVSAHVYTGDQLVAGANESLEQTTALFDLMIWVVVIATGIALLNTLSIAVLQRRRELGILRAIGASRVTLGKAVALEGLAIAAAGVLLGTALGVMQHRAGVVALEKTAGFQVSYRFLVAPVVWAFVAATVMTAIGSIAPAIRAGRVHVLDAIGYE